MTSTVPGYVREGGALSFDLELEPGYTVREIRITYSAETASGVTSETIPVESEEPSIRVIRALPAGRRVLFLRVDWLQDEGTPSFCAGTDRYAEIPVIPKEAKAGDPELPRLKGQFRVRYGKGKAADDRAVWKLEPLCDFFGCRTRVRSTGGLRAVLEPDEDGAYLYERRLGAGYCVVEYLSGRREKLKTYAYVTITATPRRVSRGAARELRGTRTVEYDVPSDEFGVCDVPRTTRDKFLATRS